MKTAIEARDQALKVRQRLAGEQVSPERRKYIMDLIDAAVELGEVGISDYNFRFSEAELEWLRVLDYDVYVCPEDGDVNVYWGEDGEKSEGWVAYDESDITILEDEEKDEDEAPWI